MINEPTRKRIMLIVICNQKTYKNEKTCNPFRSRNESGKWDPYLPRYGGLWKNMMSQRLLHLKPGEKPMLVMKFYNDRRKQLYESEPNAGHIDWLIWKRILKCRLLPKILMICTNALEVHRFCIYTANSKKHAVRLMNR